MNLLTITGNRRFNGIESFWSFAKRQLAQFNGVQKTTFHLYLKENEFRFNHRNKNLYNVLLKNLREDPLLVLTFIRPFINRYLLITQAINRIGQCCFYRLQAYILPSYSLFICQTL